MNYKDMKIEDIINWCQKHNEVEWLKAEANKTFTTKAGKTRNITFIELKLAFVNKFMPDIAPKAKPKKPTMYELIAKL
jgi:hypothetical protein